METTSVRRLRRELTDAERRLWSKLRSRQIAGRKIRRQHPIGPFVVDFACLESHLVIEIDGGQHAGPADAKRTAWLEREGYRVLRFWNHDVLERTDGVLETIRQALAEG